MTLVATTVFLDTPEVSRIENGPGNGVPEFSFQTAPNEICMGDHEPPCCKSTAEISPSPSTNSGSTAKKNGLDPLSTLKVMRKPG
ncbi:hypothetical protein MUK42_27949 [Musa troglodytarum]|uniref:Uncharacterized protein n=1 Tax=Musa troglodytarum TaxID=320322 RepID=A0A9E7JRK5_9LILI|nr:hypothetical protein MUK42_27949 [Musa troglodytarum]